MIRAERARLLIAAFRRVYPDAHCELNFSTPLQLLVATILSAQCTDKRVNLVTPELFRRHPDARALASVPQETLEETIRSTGFFRSKATSIRSMASALMDRHRGEVPETMEELTQLAGVGRKTANVVLGNAFGKNEGVVVDTHVSRLSQRLKLTRHDDAVKIEQDLMKIIPRVHWTMWSHWLIFHGRRRCFARNPDCAGCEVRKLCPSAFKIPGSTRGVGGKPGPLVGASPAATS